MFGFSEINVGLKPRPYPMPAIVTGLAVFCIALLPVTLLVAAAGMGKPFVSEGTQQPVGIWQLAIAHWPCAVTGLFISICAGVFAGRDAWHETPRTEPFEIPDEADPRVYYDDDARAKLQASFMKEAGGLADDGYWLAPYLNLPFSLETRNLLVVAASGHGKSNIIRAIASQTILRGDRTVLHCNKGDVTRCFDLRDVILISPTHRDGWAWDIGADLDGPAAATEFSRDTIQSSDQPFWSDTARLVMADTINAIAAGKGQTWGPLDLLTALLSSPDDLRARIEKVDLSASPLIASGEDGAVDKTVQGIMSTLLSAALTTLRPMAHAWAGLPPEKHFSVKKWLSKEYNGPKIVIVQTSPNFESLSTSVCGGILRRICKGVSDASTKIDPANRTTFILDEFYSLGFIEGLGKALSVAREKGLICIAAVQSMEQLHIYGKEAILLSDLFQIKIFGRLTAGEGAADAEKTIGSRQIRWQVRNTNPANDDKRRYLTKDDTKPVVSATQFSRDFGMFEPNTSRERVSAVVHYAGNAHRLEWPLTTWEVKGEGYVAAAWTTFTQPKAG